MADNLDNENQIPTTPPEYGPVEDVNHLAEGIYMIINKATRTLLEVANGMCTEPLRHMPTFTICKRRRFFRHSLSELEASILRRIFALTLGYSPRRPKRELHIPKHGKRNILGSLGRVRASGTRYAMNPLTRQHQRSDSCNENKTTGCPRNAPEWEEGRTRGNQEWHVKATTDGFFT